MSNSSVIPTKAGIQLNKVRSEIDKIDSQILQLMKKRLNLVLKIGKYKKENNLEVKDLKREKEVLEKITEKASALGLSNLFVKKIWQLLFKQSYKLEE